MKFLDVPQSGSIADRTHSHNRAGQYTRNRRSPVQPVGSGRRAEVRATFAAASAGWASLTSPQREAWNSFADSHPITDSLGQSVVLTGHQMYVRVESSRINVGIASSVTPPADLDFPDVSGCDVSFGIVAGLVVTAPTGGADASVALAVSKPFSAGRSFNKTFWQFFGAEGSPIVDDFPVTRATSLYAAEFGAPVVGQRVFVRLTPVSEDGWNGAPVIKSAIVVA